MKSWRTTLLGLACLAAGVWIGYENVRRGAWSIHYWADPFLAYCAGHGLIHARDHKAKDK